MSNVSSVYIPDNMGGNNMESMLLGSMMGNGCGFGGGGMWNNPIWALVFLGIFANGNFFGGNRNGQCTQDLQLQAIREQLTNNQNSTLLMDAIKGNNNAIGNLATNLNLTKDSVTAAINGVQQQICNLGSQNGMNFMQVVNAINSGNASLANQLSSCCCDVKQLVTTQGYENRIAGLHQSQLIQNGFAQVGYASAEQTCALKQNQTDNTNRVIAKLDQIEDDRKNREINALTAENATLRSRAERQAELAPIYQQLNDIACRQPKTETVLSPSGVLVPNCVAWNAALYGGFPFAQQGRGNVFS